MARTTGFTKIKLKEGLAAASIAKGILTGAEVANTTNASAVPGVPVLFRIDVADAATGNVDVTTTYKVRVVDAWAVKTGAVGGAANTAQLFNGATAITDALDLNIADQAVARAATINDASHAVAAGGTLRVTRTKAGGNAACIFYVLCTREA